MRAGAPRIERAALVELRPPEDDDHPAAASYGTNVDLAKAGVAQRHLELLRVANDDDRSSSGRMWPNAALEDVAGTDRRDLRPVAVELVVGQTEDDQTAERRRRPAPLLSKRSGKTPTR